MKIYTGAEIAPFLDRFESRRTEVATDVERSVAEILESVRKHGDEALFRYAKQFDDTDLEKYGVSVSADEIERAYESFDASFIEVLTESKENIKRFHSQALPQSWFSWQEDGVVLGQRVQPLERVGVYVPGGRAAYPSSLLMGVCPAQVAGVDEIFIVTPSDPQGRVNPVILAAAFVLGIDRVFRVGGAHAIAALAYGTESIPRVDKIVGPGNIYVATAKKLLFGQCGIDMVAGPIEVVLIADETADADYLAADLLAQAEHDPLASAILLTDSEQVAGKAQVAFSRQVEELPRKEIVEKSTGEYGGIILCSDMAECIHVSNRLAPEHLGLHVRNPWEILGLIRNAGAIFLGHFSPESVGDYWAGPNHILPTNGSARFFSPLRTEDFLKTSSVIAYSKQAMERHGKKIMAFARAEGLEAHARAISIRI